MEEYSIQDGSVYSIKDGRVSYGGWKSVVYRMEECSIEDERVSYRGWNSVV